MTTLKRFSWRISLLVFATSLTTNLAYAMQKTWTSEVERTNVVELYTSEGCSSCPPAEHWLSRFKNSPELWHSLLPLAFHVDYWDYLGWKDAYARAEFSERQQAYARLSHVRTVYTPGFVVAGREWKGFFNRGSLPADSDKDVGILQATQNNSRISVDYQPTILVPKKLVLHIALLGFDIKSNIKGGENEGKTITHDFVVLTHTSLFARQDNGRFQWQFDSPRENTHKPRQLGIAFWVSDEDDPTPIQATGGFLQSF